MAGIEQDDPAWTRHNGLRNSGRDKLRLVPIAVRRQVRSVLFENATLYQDSSVLTIESLNFCGIQLAHVKNLRVADTAAKRKTIANEIARIYDDLRPDYITAFQTLKTLCLQVLQGTGVFFVSTICSFVDDEPPVLYANDRTDNAKE
jgi:hypothetical protein